MSTISSIIASPESISKDIFEKYYQIIEQQRFKHESDEQLITSFDFLERIVLAIERSLQDISANDKMIDSGKEKTYFVTTELLNNWLSVIICCEDDRIYIDALSYNFIPVLSSLENIDEKNIIVTIRHIAKFNPILDFLKSRPLFTKRIEEIIKNLSGTQDISINTTRFISLLYSEYKKNSMITTIDELNKLLLDDESSRDYFRNTVLSQFAVEMADRYLEDSLRLESLFHSLKNEGVTEIRDLSKKNNLFEIIERQFEFDDETSDLIWNIIVKFDSHTFNAADIGYLLWTLSKSLESIDDIEVELTEWGDGSKWFQLKVRVKDLAAKVDITEVFKNLRQSLESVYHKKPIDEIKKFEAEAKKLLAESKKIEKEEQNIISKEEADIKNQLSLHKDILEIQSKEIEIENKKAEIRLKNLEFIKGLSDLIKDGIVSNDSDVQIMINDLIFFKKVNSEIILGDHELLDINERVEPKNKTE